MTFLLVGFLWHTAPPEEKLSPDDAQFVDVIHSAGLWIGTDEKVKLIKKKISYKGLSHITSALFLGGRKR